MYTTSINNIYSKKYSNLVNTVITCLLLMLSLANCTYSRKEFSIPVVDSGRKNSTINEVIVFLGNPGTGKSSLLNSIFQKPIFRSGTNAGTGLTRRIECQSYEDKLYVDTPGLDDIDLKYQAASEIEKALKHSNNYKIVFVATLESGRIKPADLVTINTVCEAIKTNFEYGLIINKATEASIKKVNEAGGIAGFLKGKVNKQPLDILIINFDGSIHDEEDCYFSKESPNREKLVSFINQLTAKKIVSEEVAKLDVRDYEEKIKEMEKKYQEGLTLMRSQIESLQEEQKRQEEQHREEIRRMEEQRREAHLYRDIAQGVRDAFTASAVGFAVGGPVGGAIGSLAELLKKSKK
jgi:GTP-binding protein EngB required for normal cell division